MRQEILLGRHAVPKRVRLPDGTSFVARYERISRKNLPGNIRITKSRMIRLRNKRKTSVKKKRVRFNLPNTPTQDRTRRIRKKPQENAIWERTSKHHSKLRFKWALKQ